MSLAFARPKTWFESQYELPSEWGASNDNVIANGQVLHLDEPTFIHELHFLYAGDAGPGMPYLSSNDRRALISHLLGTTEFMSIFTLTFTDNSTLDVERTISYTHKLTHPKSLHSHYAELVEVARYQ